MRKMFRVKFMYYTDRRDDWAGEAESSLVALVLATARFSKDWCSHGPGFHIVIEEVA